ncbi:TetR/AcrR family transcriptional regulator [Pedobacter sp. HDW13]|uniref:TetR/AcrR family transcriptional regulator n=1 Tax=Pedobacter sp. HDW13 TaxID=2714940 RepID=UPI00140C32B2|nr:TetR/AcrR family transcriptional regulator [Pedobacter sp. HDW13]QIL37906.1 TetR/AcrR family transcriptional regulator [Pedobacter sp. HDW13]
MPRKSYDGVIRNKERTKNKLLDAVGQIIRKEGYTGLKLKKIVDLAGVDRKILYTYFGSIENLVETYIRQRDYYMGFADQAKKLVKEHEGKNGKELVQKLLVEQLEHFSIDEDMQQILIWHISEGNPILSGISEERERIGSIFLRLLDRHFEHSNVDVRARLALIISGIYFLVLYAKKTKGLFCEIDLNTTDGIERIKRAIQDLIEETFELDKN